MFLLDRLLSRAISRGALHLTSHEGSTHLYGDPAAEPVRVRLTDAGSAWRIARNPALGAGEAYVDGRLVIENGTILELLDLVSSNLRWDRSNPVRVALWNQQRLAARWGELNARRSAKRNVAHHYDLSDQLYGLFLDPERQYSCGYFREGNQGPSGLWPGTVGSSSLDQAQRDKLDHIAAKLCLGPGMRVLDIGCGWGGMARHIHKLSGAHVLGITLSEEQLRYARAKAEELGIDSHVRYELIDYRDLQVDSHGGPFDRIVSVGMFEHVGRPNYPGFFDQVASLLADDGIALVHTIGRAGGPGATDPWTAKYIFPGGYTPALSELADHIERAWLWPADIEVWRLHYGWTLEHWLMRCRARKAEIVALYDERFFRMWEFYLAGAIMAFRHDDHLVWQFQLSRERDAVPLTRDYLYRG